MKYGYADRSGRLVVLARYAKTQPFSAGLARVEVDGRPRVVDRTGADVTPPGIDFIGIASEGLYRVWSGRKQGFMDGTFHGGLAFVGPPGSRGNYIDSKDRVVWEGR